MMRRQIVFCSLLACVLLAACAPPGLLPALAPPSPTPTPSPTRQPSATPRPTLTSTATLPSEGRFLGVLLDGQLVEYVALLDYDYRYTVLLPLARDYGTFILGFKVQDPAIPITLPDAPEDTQARFFAESASTNSGLLVVCYRSTTRDIETLLESGQHQYPVTSEIVDTNQGGQAGLSWWLYYAPGPPETVYHSYEVFFLVRDGYCALSTTLLEEQGTVDPNLYYQAMRDIAAMITMLDE